MSIFADIDFGSVPDDPFAIPDNQYLSYVTKVTSGPTNAGDKVGITIVYTISDGAYEGRQITEWKQIVHPADPANPTQAEMSSLTYLKSRMKDLGIPASRLNDIVPDDLVGIKCVITVKNKGEYRNVTRVQTVDEDFTLAE